MQGARAVVDRALEALLAALFAALTLDVGWQVATRFLLGRPSPWSEELARFLLIWLGLLGASYALGRRMHLAIELFARRVQWRRWSRRFTLASTLAFALAVLGAGGTHLVALQLELGQRSAALAIPMGWVYLALPIAGGLMAFYTLAELAEGSRPEERG
ncbi:MAG TPA: TRAP transporter small permease [Thermoanaerobaculia bacterium]|nr:TRAP transporter small permease [Thermoanaerobaculia bacterium]